MSGVRVAMSDINCLCCGREPSEFHPNYDVAWIWCLFCGRYATLRRSDNLLIRTMSFLCCIPLFSMKHTYEEQTVAPYRETINCCCTPCCLDCVETPYYCQCEFTSIGCSTRTCFYHEYNDDERNRVHGYQEEKSDENGEGV
jgi:hypothetical protein